MIASAHVVAGAVAGLAGARVVRGSLGVVVAFVLGIVSHHILDAIPHSDYAGLSPWAIRVVGTIEIILALGFIALATRRRLSREQLHCLIAGVVGAAIMDVKFLQPFLPSLAEPIQRLQDAIHPFHAGAHDRRLLGFMLELTALMVSSALLVAQVRSASELRRRG